eukprot:6437284-Pyramimonas_sp.AAC.1
MSSPRGDLWHGRVRGTLEATWASRETWDQRRVTCSRLGRTAPFAFQASDSGCGHVVHWERA